jgi:hypothetical protein
MHPPETGWGFIMRHGGPIGNRARHRAHDFARTTISRLDNVGCIATDSIVARRH